MTKRPDPSFSKPPETEDIDDLWSEIDFGAPGGDRDEPAPEPAPPPLTPAPSRSRTPSSLSRRSERARTSPEPVVKRHIEEMLSLPPSRARTPSPEPASLSLDAPSDPDEDSGGALGLVERSLGLDLDPAREGSSEDGSVDPGPSDMQDRYAVGDFTGALVIAESILETDPNHADAQRYAASCREVLTQMYAARLGSLDQVAKVAIPPEQITWLSLDHRAGFLLSLVDGESTIEELLDISGMGRLEALRIMYTLVQQRVVTVL